MCSTDETFALALIKLMQFLCKLSVGPFIRKTKSKLLKALQSCRQYLAAPHACSHIPPSKYKVNVTVLTLSPLNFFCLVVEVPERRRGLVAQQAGLHPGWRQLQQGLGLTKERPRWPSAFSVGLKPAGKVKSRQKG